MSNGLKKITAFFRRAAKSAEEIAEGEEPVATPSPGEGFGDSDRETSTNAQTAGAEDEPWSGRT